jgi:formylglycine-generating enzyme required for sulfatase activity
MRPRHVLHRLALAGAAMALAGGALAATYVPLPGGPFSSVLPQDADNKAAVIDIAPVAMRDVPVTNDEYRRFVVAHPEWRRGHAPRVFADDAYLASWRDEVTPAADAAPDAPVTEVSWFAARAFCETEGARLPTWLEWESAAAADATRADARSDPAWQQRILSWYEHPGGKALPAVGGTPNLYGVRDLHGLVWEWVDDWNALFIAGDSRTQGDPDKLKFCGAGALSILGRDSYAVLMRVAFLSSLNAADTARSLGFRCVRPAAGATQ